MYVYCSCNIVINYTLKDSDDVNTQCKIEEKEPQATDPNDVNSIAKHMDKLDLTTIEKLHNAVCLLHNGSE